mgnify:CR=1 FL=1|tara:strand:- start:110 stop:1867 length:1758 start_codon:yes stop_codon:yes gene_type:complete
MATELAALNIKISGDSADLQSDIAKAKAQIDQFEKSTTKAGKGAKGFTGGLSKLGGVSRQTRAQIQNTSFQLQDIAVQLEMGTSLSRTLSQQLPQLAGGFGAVGAVVGVLAGIGIPALAFAFSSLRGEVVDSEEALDNFSSSIQAAAEFASIAATPLEELQKTWGNLGKQIQETSAIAAQAALSKAMLEFKGVANGLKTPLEEITRLFGVLKTARAELAKLPEETGNEFGSQISLRKEEIKEITKQIVELAEAMGMSQSQASKFIIGLKKLEKTEGFENVSAASADLLKLLAGTVTEGHKVPEVLIPIVEKLRDLQTSAASGAVAVKTLAGELLSLPVTTKSFLEIPKGGVAALLPGYKPPKNKPKGGGKTDPLPGELERLKKSLMTKEELELASNDRRMDVLTKSLEAGHLKQAEFDQLELDQKAAHIEAMENLERMQQRSTLAGYSGMFGDLATLMQSSSKSLFNIGKAAALGEAVVSGYSAAVAAWDKGMKIGGPPVAAAFTAASLAKTGALISQISSANATGGGGGGAGGGGIGQQTASRPMEARISGLDPNSLFTGASITSLFDALQDEAGDRGLSVSFA